MHLNSQSSRRLDRSARFVVKSFHRFALLSTLWGLSLHAQAPTTPSPDPEASVKLDDGSVINGRVVSMTDGELTMDTDFDGEVTIDRSKVLELLSELRLRLVLDDNTTLDGTVEPGPGRTLRIRTADAAEPLAVPFSAVTAINPPDTDAVRIKGSANAGLTIFDGNTRQKSMYANGELVIRNDDHRGTFRASYLYAEDSGSVSARNGRASAKYDYFATDRFYWYGNASVESDSLRDLELRTIFSTGPGYQFIEEGDFEGEHFRKLDVSGELGVSYIHEDFQGGTKEEYVAGRWALNVDWEFMPDRVGFFHWHEGHPSFEDFDDLLIITSQGLRFTIVGGLVATAQINWTWDNVPAPGAHRTDTVYLFTLGYKFDA